MASILWVDHSDPAIPFFNEETQGLLDCRIFFSSSHDGGETWSEPIIMDTSPFNVPTPITGPTLLLSDGRLACQFELNKPYYDTSIWRHSSVMMFSADGGITWPEYAVTSNDPENRIFYWDQRLGVLADGSILDMFWTYDNRAGQYLNIHAKRSTDNGHSWSDTWDTGVPGQPAQPVSTPDAGIAMVYVDRTDQPVIKVRKSSDRGSTWPEETEAVIHKPSLVSQTRKKGAMQDAWEEMGKFSIGLPTTALLPNGNVIVVFYAGPETDRTDIHWACVNL
ncbi:MAG: hypothetical protein GWP14_00370 [Actinobacteria bacterium]|nr:hypothetical protein [Actinomycetota bacterium]